MKVAVVYNRDSQNVINLFGRPNREKMGLQIVRSIIGALREGGHQAMAREGDKDLITHLETFMPRVVKGERPGLVFNLSYGIQGQARYTHVPSILEMVGIPYVGSGPLAHSIALDKVVTKMILVQHGLPTPEFALLEPPEFGPAELPYPLMVKPRHEAVSLGLSVARNETELREAARDIYEAYGQAVLAERYIEGREINVALMGNAPPEALPPVEIRFGEGGPGFYTYEDKTGVSGREIQRVCPAPIEAELAREAQDLARKVFSAIGCCDCARVDMRLDDQGGLYILEVNSLPSLGPRSSLVTGAAQAGLDFPRLINRLVEVASARYFGTPTPPQVTARKRDPEAAIVSFLTERRDRIERRLGEWTTRTSRTSDPVGLQRVSEDLGRVLSDIGMKPVGELTDARSVRTWETTAGLEGGTLLVLHLDVPLEPEATFQAFRREPEWLYGEGLGISRAPLVMVMFALRALRHLRLLRRRPIGVLYYLDEGRDCRYSGDILQAAMSRVKRALIVRPGGMGGCVYSQRRGQRKYRLLVEGEPARPGRISKRPEVLVWFSGKLGEMQRLGSRQERVSVSVADMRAESFPMLLPHRVRATVLMTYGDPRAADRTETALREALGRRGPRWQLEQISDRPPMRDRRANRRLARMVAEVAGEWDIPLHVESSVMPSVAGLARAATATVCGVGPVARDLYTPQEAVQRISMMQRTLLLAEYLFRHAKEA